jgi:uncharacterized protein (TIGR03083 family)
MLDLAAAYAETQQALVKLTADLPDQTLTMTVPATPDWSVKDVVAHVTGVASDVAGGSIPPELDLVASLSDSDQAERRDELTARQVASRRDRAMAEIVAEWNGSLDEVLAIIRGEKALPRFVPFADAILVTDLAVHAQDVRNAIGRPGDRDSAGVRIALASYAGALMLRLAQNVLPPLRLRYDAKERMVGEGEPGATLSGDRYEIFRALAGRRTVDQMRAMDWEGDPDPYIAVLPAYPPPPEPLATG